MMLTISKPPARHWIGKSKSPFADLVKDAASSGTEWGKVLAAGLAYRFASQIHGADLDRLDAPARWFCSLPAPQARLAEGLAFAQADGLADALDLCDPNQGPPLALCHWRDDLEAVAVLLRMRGMTALDDYLRGVDEAADARFGLVARPAQYNDARLIAVARVHPFVWWVMGIRLAVV